MGYWLYIDLSEESNSVVCKNNKYPTALWDMVFDSMGTTEVEYRVRLVYHCKFIRTKYDYIMCYIGGNKQQ